MKKFFIKNRKAQKIAISVEENPHAKGLAFVMHGLGGFKEQEHIQTFANAFKENDYTVLRFDATNSFGQSKGQYENATIMNYYEDLEDVIEWSEKQDWYQEPFILVGHSLGRICIGLYAEKYAEKVKALAPVSAVVSGKLSVEAHSKEFIKKWKRTGWRIKPNKSIPGLMKKLPWSHMQDRLKYNLLEKVNNLTMPVLLIVGEKDSSTPLQHQKILYDALPGRKELCVIKNAPHTFREKKHLNEIKHILDNWIKSLG